MRRLQWVFLAGPALFGALSAPSLAQTCTSSVQTGIYADGLTLQGNGPEASSAIAAAAGIWDGCGMSGIPPIAEGAGGDLHYAVFIVPTSSGPACGATNPSTGEIVVAREYTYNGQTYPCDVNTVLAHEIGHVFGLGDSGCGGYLMSNLNIGQADNRSLQSGECFRANQNVTTTAESREIDREIDQCATVKNLTDGCGSPLILDMNRDGINTTPLDWPVRFDFAGDGRRVETAWTDPTSEEAFLALDLDGNGRVDSGLELFGNSTLLPSGATARHGFEALAVHDDPLYGGNGDGRITPADAIWRFLWLWTDRDHDGESDPEELRPLRSSHVRALHLGFAETRSFDGNVNWHRYIGTYSSRCNPAAASCVGEGLLEDVFFHLRR